MKITKNEIKKYYEILNKGFYFKNSIDKYNALFFPIETDGLDEDYSQTVILTEFKETKFGFSNSSKPGLLYDPVDMSVSLAYVVTDNQQNFNIKTYYNILDQLQMRSDLSEQFDPAIFEKDAMVVNKEHIIVKIPLN